MGESSSRDVILGRIRAGIGTEAAGQVALGYEKIARDYVKRGRLTVKACRERFIERLREYDAEVAECEPGELLATITAQISASGRRIFVAPPGIPTAWYVELAWKIEGFECSLDHGLKASEIERAEGVITAAFCGVADSGTIVLHHSPAEGRRVLTLLPDWHLCVLWASQIVETLPEYFEKAGSRDRGAGSEGAREQGTLPRLVTWISGPSATADIEMTRIKGVHGPRFLHVIVVRDSD